MWSPYRLPKFQSKRKKIQPIFSLESWRWRTKEEIRLESSKNIHFALAYFFILYQKQFANSNINKSPFPISSFSLFVWLYKNLNLNTKPFGWDLAPTYPITGLEFIVYCWKFKVRVWIYSKDWCWYNASRHWYQRMVSCNQPRQWHWASYNVMSLNLTIIYIRGEFSNSSISNMHNDGLTFF